MEEANISSDYYSNRPGKAVLDFCLGFFGIWIIGYLGNMILMFIYRLFFLASNNINSILSSGLVLGSSLIFWILLAIAAIVVSKNKGRRYIGIGIISSVIVPLLFFGACLILFAAAW